LLVERSCATRALFFSLIKHACIPSLTRSLAHSCIRVYVCVCVCVCVILLLATGASLAALSRDGARRSGQTLCTGGRTSASALSTDEDHPELSGRGDGGLSAGDQARKECGRERVYREQELTQVWARDSKQASLCWALSLSLSLFLYYYLSLSSANSTHTYTHTHTLSLSLFYFLLSLSFSLSQISETQNSCMFLCYAPLSVCMCVCVCVCVCECVRLCAALHCILVGPSIGSFVSSWNRSGIRSAPRLSSWWATWADCVVCWTVC
jgi:hypothetical protein